MIDVAVDCADENIFVSSAAKRELETINPLNTIKLKRSTAPRIFRLRGALKSIPSEELTSGPVS